MNLLSPDRKLIGGLPAFNAPLPFTVIPSLLVRPVAEGWRIEAWLCRTPTVARLYEVIEDGLEGLIPTLDEWASDPETFAIERFGWTAMTERASPSRNALIEDLGL